MPRGEIKAPHVFWRSLAKPRLMSLPTVFSLLVGLAAGFTLKDWLANGNSKAPSLATEAGEHSNFAQPASDPGFTLVVEDFKPGENSLAALERLDPTLYRKINDSFKETILLALVEQLSGEYPTEVGEIVTQLPIQKRSELSLVHLEQWSKVDPYAALEWWQSQRNAFPGEQYSLGLRQAMLSVAESDPQSAYRILGSIADPEAKDIVVVQIARTWAAQDLAGSIDWLERVRQTSISDEAYAQCSAAILSNFIKKDPEAAATIVFSLESEALKDRFLPQLIGNLVKTQPDLAYAWIDRITSPDTMRKTMLELAQSSDAIDASTFAELISSRPEVFENDAGFGSDLFDRIATTDRDGLARSLDLIPDSGKAAATETLARQRLEAPGELAGVKAWYAELSNASAADGVARALAIHFLKEDPASAIDWSKRIVSRGLRHELMASIVRYAEAKHLSNIAGALAQAEIPRAEKEALLSQLDRALEEKMPRIILP